jgi:hypothetical protein
MECMARVFEGSTIQHHKFADPTQFPVNNLGFKEGLGEEWRLEFIRDENLTDILDALEIPESDRYRVYSRRMIGDDRCQVLLVARPRETEKLKKIIVDAKAGIPTWEQFIDVTYNTPIDIEKRIIVYDDVDETEEDYPYGEETTIWNLVARNNRCGVDTYQVKAHFAFRECCGRSFVQYLNNEAAREMDPQSSEKLPTKEEIQMAEFWHEYYRPRHRFTGACAQDHIWKDDDIVPGEIGPHWYFGDDIEMEVEWSASGVYIYVFSTGDDAEGKKQWNDKRLQIEQALSEYEVEFIERAGNLNTIRVKLESVDVMDIKSLDPARKMEIAEVIEDAEDKFSDLMD